MTAQNCLHLLVLVLAAVACGSWAYADGDVTVISSPATAKPPPGKGSSSTGTVAVHRSLHKRRHSAVTAATTSAVLSPTIPGDSVTSAPQPQSLAPMDAAAGKGNSTLAATVSPSPATPTVETGLPVGRYPGMGSPIKGVSTFVPLPVTLPPYKPPAATHSQLLAMLPSTTLPARSLYANPGRMARSSDDFIFKDLSRRAKNTYNWKTNIITTEFWIGEGATPISSTTNEASAWDLDWRSSNSGSDSPYDRNGYAPGRHAATLNPFYVALPFNDLAFPEKAREWLPRGWYRRPKDGKQVSACKDRWVEIKNVQGDICYAQWEDVGPLRYDHAEYVFGDERPIGLGDDHAGLDVSPAVADYLNINGKNRYSSWRFVDDEDVRPGPWLLLDEEALLFTALHQLKGLPSMPPNLPIQRATEPIDDPSNLDSNKKRLNASKG